MRLEEEEEKDVKKIRGKEERYEKWRERMKVIKGRWRRERCFDLPDDPGGLLPCPSPLSIFHAMAKIRVLAMDDLPTY